MGLLKQILYLLDIIDSFFFTFLNDNVIDTETKNGLSKGAFEVLKHMKCTLQQKN